MQLPSVRGSTKSRCGAATAEQADRLQYELRDGPCYAAVKDERFVMVNNLAATTAFPRYGHRAVDLGIRAQAAVHPSTKGRGRDSPAQAGRSTVGGALTDGHSTLTQICDDHGYGEVCQPHPPWMDALSPLPLNGCRRITTRVA